MLSKLLLHCKYVLIISWRWRVSFYLRFFCILRCPAIWNIPSIEKDSDSDVWVHPNTQSTQTPLSINKCPDVEMHWVSKDTQTAMREYFMMPRVFDMSTHMLWVSKNAQKRDLSTQTSESFWILRASESEHFLILQVSERLSIFWYSEYLSTQ